LLNQHLKHLRSPDTVEKPEPVGRPRKSGAGREWAAVLVVPGLLIVGLLIWGATRLMGPKPADLKTEPQNQTPQVQAPQGPAPRGPVPAIGGDEFFQKVWADLHDPDYFTRKSAVERISAMKPNDERAKVASKLAELTRDEGPFIRVLAVKALGTWGSKNEMPDLIRALAHKDPSTRRETLKVIGRFRDSRSLEPVMLSFRESATRADAGQALRDMGPMAEPEVLALLNERDDGGLFFMKRDAITVLADIGSDKSVPALEKIAASNDVHYRTHLAGPARKALDAIAARNKQ